MIHAIFVDPNKLDGIRESGANYLMVAGESLGQKRWHDLKKMGMTFSISFGAFNTGGCPANPGSRETLLERIKKYLQFNPEALWLDHFRFDGHWEAMKGTKIPGVHRDCRWCKNNDRVGVLSELAQEVMTLTGNQVKVGYFAVPFKTKEVPDLVSCLGQDHFALGKIFDQVSPMLYHRMIKKPTSYISDYIKWLHNQTTKPILPIIQIKDMPDDLKDRLFEEEITLSFQEAIKFPSSGVAFFCWSHVVDKNKTSIVKKLFEISNSTHRM